jgi:hypothetical protein
LYFDDIFEYESRYESFFDNSPVMLLGHQHVVAPHMKPQNLAVLFTACAASFGSGCPADSGGSHDQDKPDAATGRDAGQSVINISGVDDGSLASTLTPSQVKKVCAAVDEAIGLAGDLAASCQVEAFQLALTSAECSDILASCQRDGMTQLGFEKPVRCATEAVDLSDCDVTVREMIDCGMQLGGYWRARTCDVDALDDVGPDCSASLGARCPTLYGSGDSGGSGGACDGIATSCLSQFTSGTCTAPGCTWSSGTNYCSGLARPCVLNESQQSCTDEPGCYWTP